MRKKFLYLLSALALTATISAGTLMLAGCGPDGQTENLTDEPLKATTTVADWSEGEAPAMFESDGWTNGNPFNVQWTANNVAYEKGVAKLTISDNPDGSEETFTEYYGSEMRTHQHFGYGDYEVSMKPAKKDGTASTFFLYTGPSELDEDGNPNPWDEIDIEFLGQDTTKVQFNYYVNGVGGHEYMYDLGFDASEDFHTYGFRWAEDYITWFVDGKPVYRVDATESNPMPSTESRILMNYWCGAPAAENWMGKYSNPGEEGPEYQWVKTSAKAIGEIPEPVVIEEFDGDWNDYEAVAAEFEANANTETTDYEVTAAADGKSAGITWTKAGNYSNVSFTVGDAAEGKNWLHLVLKNNGDEVVNGRINVRSTANTTSNSYGFGNGEELRTNAGEGTFIDLAKGEEVEVEIRYAGTLASVEIMLNSLQANDVARDGDITISEIKFATQGEIEEIEPSENNGIMIGDTNVKFETSLYIINTDDEANTMTVTYKDVKGNSYATISAGVAAVAAGKNQFTFTVKNNGTESVKLRIDILANTVNSTTAISVTGDSQSSWSASDSACVTVAAGVTETVTVTYTGAADTANIFIDSATWNDETSHSGDVTFSALSFGGEASETPDEPEEPVTPPSETPATVDVSKVTIQGSIVANDGPYTATAGNDNTINVKYDAVKGNSYLNVELAGMTADAQTHNVFTATIKNNGTETVNVRVNIQSTAQITANTQACNISATQDGVAVRTDAEWGGSFFTVEAGKTITIEIVYDYTQPQNVIQFMIDSHMGTETTHSGDITIGGMVFSSKVAE